MIQGKVPGNAFIGTRGSGKTTVINEFCDILSRYGEEEEKWSKHLSYKNNSGKQYRFWIMPPIDASVLEAKEELMWFVNQFCSEENDIYETDNTV